MGIRVKAEDAQVAAVTGVFVLRGGNRRLLITTLERIAAIAPHLSAGELRDLACQLCRDTVPPRRHPDSGDGEIRVGLTARGHDQLAARARVAARLVSRVRNGSMISESGARVSCGALGRVVLIFPGLAAAPATPAATLAGSLSALRWLDRLGVSATAAVGHGLGELTGLVWAGSLSAPEAARLVAQYGQVLSGTSAPRQAMIRLAADEATARALGGSALAMCAYEGPRAHILAGPVPAVREAARRAARLGIPASLLDVGHALHTPAMARCAAPLRSVLAQVRFGPPARRLVSTITARELTPRDDIAALLRTQLTSPVRFSEAVGAAAEDADLLLLAGSGASPDASAVEWCGLPTAGFGLCGRAGRPGDVRDGPGTGAGPLRDDAADRAAVLFAAGAMPSAAPLAAGIRAQPIDIWRDRYVGGSRSATPPDGNAGPDTVAPASRPLAPAGQGLEHTGPAPAAAGPPGPSHVRGRFIETVTALRPGAELVAEARISARTDPYLADYLIDGRAILPAAIGLEAMAQAASALARQPMRNARGVSLGAPLVIADSDDAVLRVRARVSGDGVETVLHAGAGGRLAEYARAIFVGSGVSRQAARYLSSPVAEPGGEAGVPQTVSAFPARTGIRTGIGTGIIDEAEIVDGADLYGSVCFQTGRFRRVALVSGAPPGSCRALIRGRDELPWFGCLPSPADLLVLGSPGVNDAALQVVQACVPARRLLPTGCDSLTVSGTELPGAVELRVFLVSAPPRTGAGPALTAGDYLGEAGRRPDEGEVGRRPDEGGTAAGRAESVWDIHGYDGAGNPVVAWIGLRMWDSGPLRPGRPTSDSDAASRVPGTGVLTFGGR